MLNIQFFSPLALLYSLDDFFMDRTPKTFLPPLIPQARCTVPINDYDRNIHPLGHYRNN